MIFPTAMLCPSLRGQPAALLCPSLRGQPAAMLLPSLRGQPAAMLCPSLRGQSAAMLCPSLPPAPCQLSGRHPVGRARPVSATDPTFPAPAPHCNRIQPFVYSQWLPDLKTDTGMLDA